MVNCFGIEPNLSLSSIIKLDNSSLSLTHEILLYIASLKSKIEILKKNKDCIKKNRDFVKVNKKLVKRHIEITRAYNGIAEMGKFAEELGINIKEHQEKLPEHEFNQTHTLLESGRVNHKYTFIPKVKKEEEKKWYLKSI